MSQAYDHTEKNVLTEVANRVDKIVATLTRPKNKAFQKTIKDF